MEIKVKKRAKKELTKNINCIMLRMELEASNFW